MRTVETKLFTFEELPEPLQQKAIDDYRNEDLDYYWYTTIEEYAKDIGKVMGIDIEGIGFQLGVQGAGATFEGTYEYKKGSAREMTEQYPHDDELQNITERLRDLQRKNFYGITASITEGHWPRNSLSVTSHREDPTGQYYGTCGDTGHDWHNELCQILSEFADWIYNRLEAEAEYRTSDEYITEMLVGNAYEFTESGAMA